MGNHMTCQDKGKWIIILKVKGYHYLVFERTRYVLDWEKNLISLGLLDDLNYNLMISKGYIKILRDSQLIIEASKRHCLYILQTQSLFESTSTTISIQNDKWQIWYKRVGHISDKGLQILEEWSAFEKDNIEKLNYFFFLAT